MATPKDFSAVICSLRRPFGSSTIISTTLTGRLIADFARGRAAAATDAPIWTHYLDVSADTDIRDGCTRTAGDPALTFADGDEVRIPSETGSRYVVVWVELLNRGDPSAFKRAYLLRHEAVWPGP